MNQFTFYEVGGKVRDEFLGLKNKDVDYVAVSEQTEGYSIGIIFEDLRLYLIEKGYTIFLETPHCYTIRATFPKDHTHAGLVADFVLARKEIGYKPGTREPIVVPGTLHDDLARRDFTVNAIAKSMAGEIIDPFDGVKDIKLKLLRTPISGDITFDDDPLRLLRAIRFAVTKGFDISMPIVLIMRDFAYEDKFPVVSQERIREEIYKALHHDTFLTLKLLMKFEKMFNYIFKKTDIWLKPIIEYNTVKPDMGVGIYSQNSPGIEPSFHPKD